MGKVSELISKIKSIKHINLILGAALVAVVMTVYFCTVSCSDKESENTSVNIDGSDYCTVMQVRLEKSLSEMSGVGNASVVINWDKTVTPTFGSSSSENPKATGAIIVCDGGSNPKTQIDVIFAVSTLLDLPIDKIMVYPKK